MTPVQPVPVLAPQPQAPWQGSHWSTKCPATGKTRPGKKAPRGSNPCLPLSSLTPYHWANQMVSWRRTRSKADRGSRLLVTSLSNNIHKQREQMLERSIFAFLTGLHSDPSRLHNLPSRTFELLHATLQQNDSTSSSFPVTLWPWLNIKVIQKGNQSVAFSSV